MLSKFLHCFLKFNIQLLIVNLRCLARASDLDGDDPLPRCRAHTNVLVEELELGMLWDEYGLVGDIVVSSFLLK